jgi:hypothetical protein
MDQLEETLLWSVKEDPNMLLTRLNEIKKTKSETVREFHTKFERLLQQIPRIHHLRGDYILFLYIKAYPGQFGFMLRDKGPKMIQEAHEIATKIEANISSSKVEPFYAPRAKVDTKPKVVQNLSPPKMLALHQHDLKKP